jgi:glycosyltransferase involved in cell wall biosynthesis
VVQDEAMRVHVVSSRDPWPPYTGDRLRAAIWLEALASRGDATLVSPGKAAGLPSGISHVEVRRSLPQFLYSGMRAAASGLPMHALIASGYDWSSALRRSGECDVAIVLLSRLQPWVERHLAAKRVILDAIDSLAASTAQRAAAASGPAKLFWQVESHRTERLEKRLSALCDGVVLVNGEEGSFFDNKAREIPNGVEVRPLEEGDRRFDVAFWGRLGYFANEQALRILLDEVWPRIRDRKVEATLLVAGADAPQWVRERSGEGGVTLISPMDDRHDLLRRVRVALFPFTYGTGQSNKVLEAAEAGCAIVASPQALRGFDALAAATRVGSTPAELATAALDLLQAEPLRRSIAESGRTIVVEQHSRERTLAEMRALVFGRETA